MKVYLHIDRYGDTKILVEDIPQTIDAASIVRQIKEVAREMKQDLKEDERKERLERGW